MMYVTSCAPMLALISLIACCNTKHMYMFTFPPGVKNDTVISDNIPDPNTG